MALLFGDDSSQNKKSFSPFSPDIDYSYQSSQTSSNQSAYTYSDSRQYSDARQNTNVFSPNYIVTVNSPYADISSKKSDSVSSSQIPSLTNKPNITTDQSNPIKQSQDASGSSSLSLPVSSTTLIVMAVIGVTAYLLLRSKK